MLKETYAILLVDDSEDDRLFMRRALLRSPKLTVIGEACDGAEAIAYLNGHEAFANRQSYPFPDILVMDLKMPGKTGHDVLRWLKTQSFDNLFIIVVSESLLPEDIAQSLALGAHAYHKKTVIKEELAFIVQDIERLVEQT